MKRIRFKVFGAFHTAKLEKDINDWLRKLEAKGFTPEIIRKETRTFVSSNGRTWTVVTFFYTLLPIPENEDLPPEIDIDEIGG